MFCLRCGTREPIEEKSCPTCGTPVRDRSGRGRYSVQIHHMAQELVDQTLDAEGFQQAVAMLSGLLDTFHQELIGFENELLKQGVALDAEPLAGPLREFRLGLDKMTEGHHELELFLAHAEPSNLRTGLAALEQGERHIGAFYDFASNATRRR